MRTNEQRQLSGEAVIQAYIDAQNLQGEPLQEVLTDLIADLIHATDLLPDLDWAQAVEWGYDHYASELNEKI